MQPRQEPRPPAPLSVETLERLAREVLEYPLDPALREKLPTLLDGLRAEIAQVDPQFRKGSEPAPLYQLGEWPR